ncbi:telomerase subunit EST3 ASCRUDRAFT_129940 [Ascoidea rubescens DSM 1968]|uniref:Telomere replication protein EST3 n=1 Tax=Ascoidea rubescens DSM 1968 TaxID=1344418 RepID=A0A1D2V8W5_9ASCO|nr:hypothetical protein ASCRUDRAFT_129940 [Ascoidea rubescens DSM 1968]ODV58126.1 hypothetical protein ASCRUDRAFT_129940 [Ascoidea rubescens DSM 1968]
MEWLVIANHMALISNPFPLSLLPLLLLLLLLFPSMPPIVTDSEKVLNSSLLQNWLLDSILIYIQKTSIPIKRFNNQPKNCNLLKLLKFIKIDTNGIVKALLSDSSHSILCEFSKNAISNYERKNKSRLTNSTTNSIFLIKNSTLLFLNYNQLINQFDFKLNQIGFFIRKSIYSLGNEWKITLYYIGCINRGVTTK